ncbi:hypothetical protein CR513_55164, partial [Mucuna pruriens]
MTSQNVVGPPPHAARDPPYGMSYGWNIEAPNTVNNDDVGSHVQKDIGAQHQGLRTAQPFTVHKQMPQTEEKWQSLEERLCFMDGGNGYKLEAVDLCLVSDVGLPANFKTLEFGKYKGSSCLKVHLAMYFRKMAAHIYDDKILIHCFQDSLTGVTLSWYVSLERGHIKTWRDMLPDRSRLQNMIKKEQEGFKGYAQR